MPYLEVLLDSIERCSRLSLLSLVCPTKNPWKISSEEFSNRFLNLCTNLKSLVAFFALFNVPEEVSQEATTLLKKRFKKERPALRADIQSGERMMELGFQSRILPVMYSDVLTRVVSNVAIVPFESDSFLHRSI